MDIYSKYKKVNICLTTSLLTNLQTFIKRWICLTVSVFTKGGGFVYLFGQKWIKFGFQCMIEIASSDGHGVIQM